MIKLKRVYDPPDPQDGLRFLVDRIWPRGMKKEAMQIVGWIRDAAPSNALRRWFGHDPARWEEFRRRYTSELAGNPATWQPLFEAARNDTITLLYSAHDLEHNNAIVLKHFLKKQLEIFRAAD
jgi:uncharacterized protein YeaO (DUF488 family)